MVKEENAGYAASAQIMGLKVGVFLSTTVYLAFNSIDFCNHYIYQTPQKVPVLDEVLYLKIWGYMVVVITAFTLTRSEEQDRIIPHEEHEITSLIEITKISYKLATNKNMMWLTAFFICEKLVCSFSIFIAKIYLLDELNYSQEKFSFITLLLFPLNMFINVLIAKFSNERPLSFYYICKFIYLGVSLFVINITFYNYTSIETLSPALLDVMLFICFMMLDFTYMSSFTTRFAFANRVCDVNVAATHVTIIASLSNLAMTIPKTFTYKIVDLYGVFTPNLIG